MVMWRHKVTATMPRQQSFGHFPPPRRQFAGDSALGRLPSPRTVAGLPSQSNRLSHFAGKVKRKISAPWGGEVPPARSGMQCREEHVPTLSGVWHVAGDEGTPGEAIHGLSLNSCSLWKAPVESHPGNYPGFPAVVNDRMEWSPQNPSGAH